MRLPTSAAYAALAVLALACRSDRGVRAVQAPPAATGSDTSVMQTAGDSLGLELVLPRLVRAADSVSIRLLARNRTRRTLDLYLRGRTPTFDVVIARSDGEVVWRRLEDEIIPAIVHLRPLGPGQLLEAEAVWDQRTNQGRPLPPGEYTARGLLLVEGDPLETPWVPFRAL